MKIAFFVPHLTRVPGFENNVSAHVQLPCAIAQRLLDAGHEVEFITDSLVDGYTMPVCIPKGIRITPMVGQAFVTSADKAPFKKLASLFFTFFKMAKGVKDTALANNYDVIHFYGTERLLLLSKLVSIMGIRTPMVMTYNHCTHSTFYNFVKNRAVFWSQFKGVVVSMEYMKTRIPKSAKVEVLKHGIIKDLSSSEELIQQGCALKRVLFWRTPNAVNGVDICISLFDKLAPLYPEVQFDLAVRAESDLVDLAAYEQRHDNGHVYRFPYSEGISLEGLLAESICVLQPFREYTYHPQLVILESLSLGIPVIASKLPGVDELVEDGENGFVFELSQVDRAEAGLRRLLDSPELRAEMATANLDRAKTLWSWEGYTDRLISFYSSFH